MPKDNLTMNTKTNPASLESVKNPKVPKAVMKTPPPKKGTSLPSQAAGGRADKVSGAPGAKTAIGVSGVGAGRKLGNHFSNS
jgi:hypothetical protein